MTKRLSFGFLCDFRNPPPWHRPWPRFYAEMLDFIVEAERLGFEGIWLPEHHNAEDGFMPSPMTVLAAVAARTNRVKIGTAVALAPLHHPVRFAEDAALIDIISDGRLEMAIAVGYRRRETDSLGVPFATRGRRTDEFVEIVRRLWAGETVTHESEHFSIRDAAIMPPAPRGHIPLYIGGFSEKALWRVARLGDGYHGKIELYESYLAKLAACGKDPATARVREHDINFFVAEDPDRAWQELGPHLLYGSLSYSAWLHEDRAKYDLDLMIDPMTLDELRASGRINIMTPARAIAHFEDMLARCPALEHFMMYVPPGMPPKQFAPYAELFAKEVMPAFG